MWVAFLDYSLHPATSMHVSHACVPGLAADRTPKQKLKLAVTQEALLVLFNKYKVSASGAVVHAAAQGAAGPPASSPGRRREGERERWQLLIHTMIGTDGLACMQGASQPPHALACTAPPPLSRASGLAMPHATLPPPPG